jgi:hypothetical protein
MASATDVITYIGVPLAVLGVLPILYNTALTLATLAKVRRMLKRGRLEAITRGDVINHVIEIDLPRYTIAPLQREEPQKKYWRLHDHPSPIPGGSWTIFNWKRNRIGQKTQRIDYSDQLRQPQAEVAFEELIGFLMDLGAVPDEAGFRMLRGSGLWIPVGTALLRAPDRIEPVLTIAPLDDSDGNLSLAVRWSSNWGMRDPSSLPPYWVLIRGEFPPKAASKHETPEENLLESKVETTTVAESEKSLTPKTLKYAPVPEETPPAMRCQIGVNGVTTAIPNDFDAQMFDQLDIGHLKVDETNSNITGVWFASAITAFGTSSQTVLWSYKIPSEILSFAKKDTIPCGILVLLDVVEESVTPEWATKYNDEEEANAAAQRRLKETTRAFLRENQLPPDQKAAAVRERRMKEHEEFVDGINAKTRRDAQRAEQRMIEAIQSPKWDSKLVAEHMLTWLKKGNHVREEFDLKRAVEVLLWKMVNDPVFAIGLGSILDEWKAFVENGGMRRADYMALKEKQVMFAYASLLVAVIEDSLTAAHGTLAMDLQECIRIWKKVRLG